MVWSCLSILKLIITMKLPAMVTKLKSPEATANMLAKNEEKNFLHQVLYFKGPATLLKKVLESTKEPL